VLGGDLRRDQSVHFAITRLQARSITSTPNCVRPLILSGASSLFVMFQ